MLSAKTEARIEQFCEMSGDNKAALLMQSNAHTVKRFFGGAEINSIFPLAELGQALCTLSLLFIAESEDRLQFSDRIIKFFPDFPSKNRTILDLVNQSKASSRICEPKICADTILQSFLLESILEKLYDKKLSELFADKIARKLHLEHTQISEVNSMEGAGMYSTLDESMLCFQHLLKQASANPAFVNSIRAPNAIYFGLQNSPNSFSGAIGVSSQTNCLWHLERSNTSILFLSEKISSSQITLTLAKELQS